MRASYLIAAAAALGAGAWIASGQMGNPDTRQAADAGPIVATHTTNGADALVRVRARVSEARPKVRDLAVRGRTAFNRQVVLMAETAGRVGQIKADEGALVRQGDVLVRFDLKERGARLEEAQALLRQREIEYDAAVKLSEKGFRSTTKLAESRAQLDQARALLKAMEIEIANTVIRAPFAGVIEHRDAEIGAYIDRGKPVATLVDLDPLLVIAQIGERDIPLVTPGQTGRVRLVTGETLAGTVTFVGRVADEATRTFRVELEVANPDLRYRAGVSAEVLLPVATVQAHQVTPAILSLSEDGTVGIKMIGADRRVVFAPATIVGDDAGGVWLTGLPERIELITVGHEFVQPGEPVEAVIEDGS